MLVLDHDITKAVSLFSFPSQSYYISLLRNMKELVENICCDICGGRTKEYIGLKWTIRLSVLAGCPSV